MAPTSSGSGKPFGGRTPYSEGQLVSDNGATQVIPGPAQPQPDVEEDDTLSSTATPLHSGDGSDQDSSDSATGDAAAAATPTAAEIAAAGAAAEKKTFEAAAAEIKQAIASDPALATLGQQLSVDMTSEGLRIQIMDADKQAMFATGSADLDDNAKLLLSKIAPVLQKLAEPVSIAGYTDAQPYAAGDRTNWELSADRANATRRFLEQNGLPGTRIASVSGHADRDLLLPGQPLAAVNRRIAIVVLRQAAAPAGPVIVGADAPPAAPGQN
jgi:chemotaxis protein MotB